MSVTNLHNQSLQSTLRCSMRVRIFEQIVFCFVMFLAATQFAMAAGYTVTQLPPEFRLRNNNGDQVVVTETFSARSEQDWEMHSTVSVTNGGNVIAQFT